MPHAIAPASQQRIIDATVWFNFLMVSDQTGEFAEAAKAQAELNELGIQVDVRRPHRRRPGRRRGAASAEASHAP